MESTGRIAEMVAKRQKRLTGMVIIMIAFFNVSWTPYAVVAFLELIQWIVLPTSVAIPGLLFCKT